MKEIEYIVDPNTRGPITDIDIISVKTTQYVTWKKFKEMFPDKTQAADTLIARLRQCGKTNTEIDDILKNL